VDDRIGGQLDRVGHLNRHEDDGHREAGRPDAIAGGIESAVRARVEGGTPMANAKMLDDTTALVTWPVDVWFNGSRTFQAVLDFGRPIASVTFDPNCRFPDRDTSDNVWPKGTTNSCGR
jgi:hypothetical protein